MPFPMTRVLANQVDTAIGNTGIGLVTGRKCRYDDINIRNQNLCQRSRDHFG